MPTPVGHVLGGLAAAFLADSTGRRHQLSPALLIASAAVAVAPDLDLLVGSHRTYTHSVGAVLVVGLTSWLVARGRVPNATRAAAILMAAYSSHLVVDWTGKDTSTPPGLMIAWPFSSAFYVSGWNLFGEVSRRYWLPEEFVFGNVAALAWEVLVLAPILLLAWAVWSKRTLQTNNEEGKTNKARPTR
jgi:membrane-bound metal-dependent hydrolase YbcI (DUF457 family)